MSVNTLNFEQAAELMASLHEQATGEKTLTPTDLSSFISVAQKTLASGYDNVMNAISQMVGRTIISVRSYNRKFPNLVVDTDKWGGITRKIQFLDDDPENSKVYDLTEGGSVDHYVIKKPKALQTVFVGADIWSDHYTTFRDQLDDAFSSPSEFGSFWAGVVQHFSNMFEQRLEELSRAAVVNFIAGKNAIATADNDGSVLHLLTEYNTLTGQSFTAADIRKPENWSAFNKWMFARVADITEKMTERSELFQKKLTNARLMRHTPLEFQKVYMLSEYLNSMRAEVLADTYHDSFLTYSDVEAINYWQSIKAPDEISATPSYIDSNAEIVESPAAQVMSDVIGVIFDRDAIAVNVYEDNVYTTPFNAAGEYFNTYRNSKVRYANDFTEKGVVLKLD